MATLQVVATQQTQQTHPLDAVTRRLIGVAFEVANTLGPGFLEKVYQRAFLTELTLQEIPAKSQVPFAVHYKGQHIGEYVADILVEDAVVVELKCTDHLTNDHFAQCLNYLKASGKQICLLFNFQRPHLEWKRIILDR